MLYTAWELDPIRVPIPLKKGMIADDLEAFDYASWLTSGCPDLRLPTTTFMINVLTAGGACESLAVIMTKQYQFPPLPRNSLVSKLAGKNFEGVVLVLGRAGNQISLVGFGLRHELHRAVYRYDKLYHRFSSLKPI